MRVEIRSRVAIETRSIVGDVVCDEAQSLQLVTASDDIREHTSRIARGTDNIWRGRKMMSERTR